MRAHLDSLPTPAHGRARRALVLTAAVALVVAGLAFLRAHGSSARGPEVQADARAALAH